MVVPLHDLCSFEILNSLYTRLLRRNKHEILVLAVMVTNILNCVTEIPFFFFFLNHDSFIEQLTEKDDDYGYLTVMYSVFW